MPIYGLNVIYAIVVKVYSHRLCIRDRNLMDKITLMPANFGVPEEDGMENSIDTMDEVVRLSQKVWNFCDDHGCDEKRKYVMAMCVEEMAGNIIKYGFSHDHKEHSIDVRVVKNGDDYMLRIHDDCPIFDPVKQLELYSDEEPLRPISV